MSEYAKTILDPEYLRDRHEYSSYIHGLQDALELTKPQIKKAIRILEDME